MFVILAMQGLANFEDWKAKKSIEIGKTILGSRNLWFLNYVPRTSNACAHHLAKWGFHLNYSGSAEVSLLLDVLPEGCF